MWEHAAATQGQSDTLPFVSFLGTRFPRAWKLCSDLSIVNTVSF